jgi:methyl-accepting chemotaxis protein
MEANRRNLSTLRAQVGRSSIVHHVLWTNLLGIALVAIALIIIIAAQASAITTEKENRRFADHYDGFLAAINANRDTAIAMAMIMAQRADIQTALAEQNRPELIRLTMPVWLALDRRFNVPQCHFSDAAGVSFLRLHALDSFGDDLSTHRQTIMDTIARREPVGGLEMGKSGLGIRGVAPIWRGPAFIGTVEFGLAFDRAFLVRYAADTGLELGVHITDAYLTEMASVLPETELWLDESRDTNRRGLMLHTSSLVADIPVAPDVYAEVMANGTPRIIQSTYGGEHYATLVGPVYDYAQRSIGVVEIVENRSDTVAKLRRWQLLGLTTGLVILAAAGALSYVTMGHMIAPLAAISEAAGRASEGAFAEPIAVTAQNEVGVLAEAFNHMTANLQSLLGQIAQTSQQLSGSGEQLAAEMNQINSTIEQIALTVNEMALGAGSQAQRVEEASRAMVTLAKATGQITGNAQRTDAASRHAIQVVEDVRRVVETLGQKATRIERIVVDVDRVADQTNLLALNASIEAARAGEAGTGFAVVAHEVRRLADNSARLVAEIAELSQEIGNDLEHILNKMEETQQAVKQTAAMAQETTRAVQDQNTSSDAMVAAINEIAAVAEESAASSEQVAATVDDRAASVERIAKASQSLAAMAHQLQATLGRFGASGSHTAAGKPPASQ